MSGHGKTGSSMPEGDEVEPPDPGQDKSRPFLKPRAQAKGPNMLSLCTCWGKIFQYDVLIHVTQIMSFVCKQTVRTVVCNTNFGKQTTWSYTTSLDYAVTISLQSRMNCETT